MLVEEIRLRQGDGSVVVRKPPGCTEYRIVEWSHVLSAPSSVNYARTRFQALEDIAKCLGGEDTRAEAERLFDVIGW